ncbi:MAG TPA: hypothetical protein VD994_14085 [Prosthecobacter sp.]|nr:hypothetical protein [Prosthecobacter sp.]
MSAAPTPSRTQGRVIRAALVILPAGTIFFGIISFGIWWWKKQRVEERSYKFATAMRRDLNAAAVDRYTGILREVLSQSEDRRLPATASFLDSSMAAENMGYNVRRENFQAGAVEVANVDAELTGKQRPREVVLLLAPYGDPAKLEIECHALAALMSLAHALAGENRTVTLRFAGVPLGVKDQDGRTAIERLAAASRGREERLMRVFVLGGPGDPELQEIRRALDAEAQGTVVQAVPPTTDTAATLQAATALKTVLMSAIEK